MATRRDTLKYISASAALGALLPFNTVIANNKAGRFQARGDQFELDGRPFQVLAGEMHYPRVPRALWRDRMRKLKSLGLNTLSTYVFWNAHEQQRGQYDFSGNLDIAAYLRMAQEEGLWVCLRPGPYVCAEWENGGFPTWLFPDESVPARSTHPNYLQPVQTWFKRLGAEIKPLLISQGGPVILTQVENEYGSYGDGSHDDKAHMQAIYKALTDAGFDGAFYTADGAAVMKGGVIDGLPAAINFGTHDKAKGEFAKYRELRQQGPMMCGELWAGWFDHFGETHKNMPVEPLLESLEWMLSNKCSFSLYMFHGGTSWGFTAGANFQPDSQYAPDITSYDYDGVLDEAGRPTPKFHAVKALFQRYLPEKNFHKMPQAETFFSIPRFRFTQRAALSQLYGKAISSEQPQSLESLGQDYGLVLYRHKLTKSVQGTLRFGDVRDFALVGLDNQHLGTLDRRFAETEMLLEGKRKQQLDVLVDVMGRVNYGAWIGKDQKGLIGSVTLDNKPLEKWQHFSLPLDDLTALRFSSDVIEGPAFYRAQFEVKEEAHTFLDMRGWGKGYVWLNGFNLGRYWSVGPQRSLFVPASLLKQGANEVIVLDLFDMGERSLSSSDQQIWDRVKTNI